MTARVERLLGLADELRASIQSLATGTTPARALTFLDCLARCEAFDSGEIGQAGARDLLQAATNARTEAGADLAASAWQAIRTDVLLARGYELAESHSEVEDRPVDEPGPVEWAEEILQAANATPWLPKTVQPLLAEFVERASAIVGGNPAAFVEAAGVSEDRREYEHPERVRGVSIGEGPERPLAMPFLRALAEAPELARVDRETELAEPAPSPGALATLDRILAGFAQERGLLRASDSAPPVQSGFPVPCRTTRGPLSPTRRVYLSGDSDCLSRIAALSGADADGQPDAFAAALVELRRVPCRWVRRALADEVDRIPDPYRLPLQAELNPMPGCVPLLVYDPKSGAGAVLELRIRLGAAEARRGPFGMRAWEAIRNAMRAAVAATPMRLPPAPIEDHAVEVVGGDEEQIAVEGASIGLAAALAFVSCWTRQAMAPRVAATAALGYGGAPGPVGYVREKAEAWRRYTSHPDTTLLAARENLPQLADFGGVVAVESLGAALSKAGLDAGQVSGGWVSTLSSVAHRRARLNELRGLVETQDLREFSATARPWLALAEQMRLLLESLVTGASGEPARRLIPDDDWTGAAAWAALAYTHAGDTSGCDAMLRHVDKVPAEDLPPAVLVLKHVVAVGHAIDRATFATEPTAPALWKECEALAAGLRESEAGLPAKDRELLRGFVVGTLGRALLHGGHAAQAIAPLREAAVVHETSHFMAHEAGRSYVHLSMALRVAGEGKAALETLDRAERLHAEKTRPYSAEYFASCSMYRRYERGRVLLSLGRAQEAMEELACAEEAAESCRPWPLPGILRSMAQALRALGRDSEADEVVRQMPGVFLEGAPAFNERLVEEARGSYRAEGEVY